MKEKSLYVVGDIHGDFKELVFNLVVRHGLSDCAVLLAGDIGFGFNKRNYYDHLYNKIKGKLEKNNITLYAIRGNHDDPAYFSSTILDYPRLKLVKDYDILDLCGYRILCIGGAVSTDREWRVSKNLGYEKIGSSRRLWWENEGIVQDMSLLPGFLPDVIISHEAPICFQPVIVRESEDLPVSDWEKILESRKYLEKVLVEMRPKYWFHGHYHKSSCGTWGRTLYRGLEIMEIFNIPTDGD